MWKKLLSVVFCVLIIIPLASPIIAGESNNYIRSVDFSPDGKMIAVGVDNGTAFVYKENIESNIFQLYRWFNVWEGAASSYVAWNKRGELAASTSGIPKEVGAESSGRVGKLKIWDVESQSILHNFTLPDMSSVNPFHWSPSGNKIAYITTNFTTLPGGSRTPIFTYLNVLDVNSSENVKFNIAQNMYATNISEFCWSPDESAIAFTNAYNFSVDGESNNTGVRIINLTLGNIEQYMELNNTSPVVWHPSKPLIALRDENKMLFINTSSFIVTKSFLTEEATVGDDRPVALDWSPSDVKIAFISGNEQLSVLDYDSLNVSWSVESECSKLDWSPEGSKIVTTTMWSSEMMIWDSDTGELIQTIVIPSSNSTPHISLVPMLIAIGIASVFFSVLNKRNK